MTDTRLDPRVKIRVTVSVSFDDVPSGRYWQLRTKLLEFVAWLLVIPLKVNTAASDPIAADPGPSVKFFTLKGPSVEEGQMVTHDSLDVPQHSATKRVVHRTIVERARLRAKP